MIIQYYACGHQDIILVCALLSDSVHLLQMDIKTSRTTGKIPMVRIRNPWGNECEWKGSWSDK